MKAGKLSLTFNLESKRDGILLSSTKLKDFRMFLSTAKTPEVMDILEPALNLYCLQKGLELERMLLVAEDKDTPASYENTLRCHIQTRQKRA